MPIFKPKPMPPSSKNIGGPGKLAQGGNKRTGPQGLGIFGKQRFLSKSSFATKVRDNSSFFTDRDIKMSREDRKNFVGKIDKLTSGKTTLNPGDLKMIDKKLRQEEFLARGTSKEFKIKGERKALKKMIEPR